MSKYLNTRRRSQVSQLRGIILNRDLEIWKKVKGISMYFDVSRQAPKIVATTTN